MNFTRAILYNVFKPWQCHRKIITIITKTILSRYTLCILIISVNVVTLLHINEILHAFVLFLYCSCIIRGEYSILTPYPLHPSQVRSHGKSHHSYDPCWYWEISTTVTRSHDIYAWRVIWTPVYTYIWFIWGFHWQNSFTKKWEIKSKMSLRC